MPTNPFRSTKSSHLSDSMPNTPSLRWDAAAGRYRRANGSFVSAGVVRAELDKSLAVTAQRTRALAEDLRAGRISLDGFRTELRAVIKDTQLRSAALARGGWAQMDATAFGRTGQIIRSEYGYLEGWIAEIQAGAPLDGRLNARASLYAQAGRGTFHLVQAEEMVKQGTDLEANVLHPAEHCAECLAQTDMGWVEIGTLVPVGSRECMRNCRCTISYKRSAAA